MEFLQGLSCCRFFSDRKSGFISQIWILDYIVVWVHMLWQWEIFIKYGGTIYFFMVRISVRLSDRSKVMQNKINFVKNWYQTNCVLITPHITLIVSKMNQNIMLLSWNNHNWSAYQERESISNYSYWNPEKIEIFVYSCTCNRNDYLHNFLKLNTSYCIVVHLNKVPQRSVIFIMEWWTDSLKLPILYIR